MIIPARPDHVCQMLVEGVRQADREEIAAAAGTTPAVALFKGLQVSTKKWAIIDPHTDRAIAVFGVAPWQGNSRLGIPWFIATPSLSLPHNRREFLENTHRIVDEMGAGFDYLINYTDVRHRASHRWLQWAGFQFDDYAPEFGAQRRPFFRFSKETNHV